ncbi:MAG: Flp family type IVb pilin [Pseudodesulfovibrio sp.]|uniref:Flp/Fap pilin component n=1 Tax=Pseudodesulfovibrio aespoeensis (strain ATCC 700646 / DSM 10631 / Aspo-2) TaxID=643562 RepID=E6VYP3_PSEA9|nr:MULTISPECIES: Flp family type IVb pilin [Pseudodesulfovibrio]MBU4192657.1 Flp family type IVb pilin [Pseudomonadota bacterium]ADU63910.1 Flp/Fap pilin component [Pseudodesulfovibrio aespoeensis Aspo-2]MBU4243589.1 Flp family type IVb pilin [Pseudomonadota bacterium]MBU4378244.1 Flp family type IVb pilin [Pseudomonadota bacterium]MBU4475423.1 Flp family type IVb pilin [Pseudomonadota bacterium]
MSKIMNLIMNEEGATALEYGLLAALIAAAIVGAVTTLGGVVSTTFSSIATSMQAATATAP